MGLAVSITVLWPKLSQTDQVCHPKSLHLVLDKGIGHRKLLTFSCAFHLIKYLMGKICLGLALI